MQLDNRKDQIEKEIQKYYTKFKAIYTKEHYPEWFATCNDHNKQFGEKGYKKDKKGHQLGHYAILQNPVPRKSRIVLVGKNNSWFDENSMEKSLKIVKSLRYGIPTENYLTKKTSKYSKQLCEIFKEPSLKKLFKENTIGMNRVWLQTGPDDKEIGKMKGWDQACPIEERFSNTSLIHKCHNWTEKIIRDINPEVVILFGNASDPNRSWKLFNGREDGESFVIKHCNHPGNRMRDGKNIVKGQIKAALVELLNG